MRLLPLAFKCEYGETQKSEEVMDTLVEIPPNPLSEGLCCTVWSSSYSHAFTAGKQTYVVNEGEGGFQAVPALLLLC